MSDVKFIDRRVDEDQDQGPSDLDRQSDEQDRQARRQGIRQQMAEHAVALEKASMLDDEIRQSHLRVDAASDRHQQECGPWQSELETLEKNAIRRIAERLPADQDQDKRRRELIGMISAANAALEETVEHEKRLRRPAENQVYRLRQDFISPVVFESRLAQEGNACPALSTKLFIAQQDVKFAEVRRGEAAKAVRIVAHNVTEIRGGRMVGNLAAMRRRLGRWSAELAAAGDAVSEALARSSAIGREIVNE